jgi:predicted TPR repeat methyltransferase
MSAASLFVTSGDLAADRRYQWALDHAARGDFSAAVDILLQTVELAPAFATAWFALGAIRDRLGERDAAIAAFENAQKLDPDDYHGARLQLARLGAGDAAPAMSATYVRRLFDQYATRFETSLVERLDYCGPALLREAVAAVMWRAGRPLRFDAMLDLGCGTGLAGAAFAPFVDGLVGVDLAPAMIARAQAKGLYQRLVTADVLDALKAEASAEIRYRLAVAADVFVYVNDIGPAVAAVADILTLDGLFAFTVETHAGEGIKLLPTLRYAHAEDYVRTVLRKSGLAVARIDRKPIRSEKAVPVDSLVVVAQASTAP